MPDKLVTVARFTNDFDAQLARIKLAGEGIEAILLGGNFAAMYPGPQFAQIELRVRAEQAGSAVRILNTESNCESKNG